MFDISRVFVTHHLCVLLHLFTDFYNTTRWVEMISIFFLSIYLPSFSSLFFFSLLSPLSFSSPLFPSFIKVWKVWPFKEFILLRVPIDFNRNYLTVFTINYIIKTFCLVLIFNQFCKVSNVQIFRLDSLIYIVFNIIYQCLWAFVGFLRCNLLTT